MADTNPIENLPEEARAYIALLEECIYFIREKLPHVTGNLRLSNILDAYFVIQDMQERIYDTLDKGDYATNPKTVAELAKGAAAENHPFYNTVRVLEHYTRTFQQLASDLRHGNVYDAVLYILELQRSTLNILDELKGQKSDENS